MFMRPEVVFSVAEDGSMVIVKVESSNTGSSWGTVDMIPQQRTIMYITERARTNYGTIYEEH